MVVGTRVGGTAVVGAGMVNDGVTVIVGGNVEVRVIVAVLVAVGGRGVNVFVEVGDGPGVFVGEPITVLFETVIPVDRLLYRIPDVYLLFVTAPVIPATSIAVQNPVPSINVFPSIVRFGNVASTYSASGHPSDLLPKSEILL